MKTIQQAQQNWSGSAQRAATAWTAGVDGFTGDWAGATTRQQAVMLANLNDAVNSGRWARGVQDTGTQGWKDATKASGSNFVNGFTKGATNYNLASNKFMPAIQNGVAGLSPRGDIFANLDRSRALALYLHGLKGTLGAKA